MASVLLPELSGLPHFDCIGDIASLGNRWKRWLRAFHLYVAGRGVTDNAQKQALLLHCAGMDVQDVFYTLPEGEGENVFDKCLSSLNTHFSPQVNVPYERHSFRNMCQTNNESIDQYITRLRQKAESCSFDNVDEQIRDQVIEKCNSHALRRKLLEKGRNLTLQKLCEIARSMEMSEIQAKEIEGATAEIAKVYVKKPNLQKHRDTHSKSYSNPQRRKTNQPGNKNIKCFACGYMGHTYRDQKCPARGKECERCHFKGHFKACCKTKLKENTGKVNRVDTLQNKSDSNDDYVFTVNEMGRSSGKVDVTLGGVKLQMIIDSGASCNVVDKQLWEKLKLQKIKCQSKKCEKILYGYGNSNPLKTIGTFVAEICTRDRQITAEFVVIEGQGQPLLGKDSAEQLGVLKLGHEINTVKSQPDSDIVREFRDCFTGFGKLKDFQLNIPIDKTVRPVAQQVRRVPFQLRDKLENKLQELEELDIIERVEGPTPWVSPVVVIPKKMETSDFASTCDRLILQ